MFCHGVTRFLHHYPYVTSVCLTRTQMHFPQSLPLHRINGFVRFFHGFISALLLHSGHTSKPQFFHCFSIVARVLYAIMVPHVSLNFSIVFPSHQFPSFYSYFTWHHFGPTSEPQFFHCFSIVLLHFFIIVPRFFHCFSIANGLTSKPQFFSIAFPHSFSSSFTQSSNSLRYQFILPFHQFFQFFAMVLVISVCLTLTQMHLPQSLPLHRINGIARFFHGFISVLLLHSGHTSKPQFFHCFSIVARVLYAIMVPHRSLNFSIVFPSHQFPSFYSYYFIWHHFGPTSEPQLFHCFSTVLLHFFIIVPRFFHCFSITNGLTSKPQFFPLLFHSFTRHHFPLHSSLPSVFSQFFLQFYSIVP